MPTELTPSQCRAGRAMIEWTQAHLAKSAGIGVTTLQNFENGKSKPIVSVRLAIRRALEDAGVMFIAAGAKHGPGVRINAPPRDDGATR